MDNQVIVVDNGPEIFPGGGAYTELENPGGGFETGTGGYDQVQV